MSKYSDNDDKPFTDINKYLPTVFQSDVNKSLFDQAFNRHLTKDDTVRVAGFIGQGNPQALIDRQIKESTPHRQAFQLAPTMYAKVGTVETALSFKAFEAQLELIGVDFNRLPLWGDTLKFNWVPPINIDMLINYQDYFWKSSVLSDQPQYFTIENRCNKVRSKIASYQHVLQQRGDSFNVVQINFATNEFVVSEKLDDLFVSGFIFFTKNTTNINLQNKFWTVDSSVFDLVTNITTIRVVEPIAIISASAPIATFIGQWWYDIGASVLKQWDGSSWIFSSPAVSVTISLTELLDTFQIDANCACNEDFGWDVGPWDDNQLGSVLWDTALLLQITWATEAEWITANGVPSARDIWYDTTTDALQQRNDANTVWVVSVANFSVILAQVKGTYAWDQSLGCQPQQSTQWSQQNEWIHKSEVQSYSGVKRAQLPIIEYDSNLELNQWTEITHVWKYRPETDQLFNSVVEQPTRIELEPIKGYVAFFSGGVWYLYLFDAAKTINRDIDYSSIFVPNYQFRITDDGILSEVYTVNTVEYREITVSDSIIVTSVIPPGYMCTVITLAENIFSAPVLGGGFSNVRVEPVRTSKGDTWRGYHAHWVLDLTATTTAPISSCSWDIFRKRDLLSIAQVVLTGGFDNPPSTEIYYGTTYQQLTINTVGITQINLLDQFLYDPSMSRVYATPNSDELRVYVNNIRQYGNYTKIVSTGMPNYTLVGSTIYTTQLISFVTGIIFDVPLNNLDLVRIEIGPAAFIDMGYFAVPVRTEEDETQFTLDLSTGAQPVYQSLSKNVLLEQSKTVTNQYPLFNIYDVISSQVIDVSSIFSYKEDSSQPINSFVHRRVIISSDGKDFDFEQHLTDKDNGILYGYRNVGLPTGYWYSSLLGTVKFWDGDAWASNIVVTLSSGGVAIRYPVISDVEPVQLLNVEMAFWFNSTNNILYQRNVSTLTWVQIANIILDGTDPSLRTVWRHGLNNEQYIPQYVDKDRNPITVGDPAGDWEVVDQWFYNSEHQNKQDVNYSQLVTHFSSILQQQPLIPGLVSGGLYTLTQEQINYGLGGTIKEHNDSFDTLISAINVNNVTPVGIFEFAFEQYVSGTLIIRDIINKNIASLFTTINQESLLSLLQYISDTVILQYEQNDFQSQVFGDTTAFDPITQNGVQNWISTLPMFGLNIKFHPHLNVDGDLVQLFSHDGHRVDVSYTAAEQDKLSRIVCNTTDTRISNGKFGIVSSLIPPVTVLTYLTHFGGNSLRSGVYWYQAGSGVRKLFRFEAYSISSVAPSFLDAQGNTIPDGVMYYNTLTNTVYRKTGLFWIAITSIGSSDITPLWVEVNFSVIYGEVLLAVENRLYEVTPNFQPVFDFSSLTPTFVEQVVYNNLYQQRFNNFVVSHDIVAPLINSTYNASDAFSWNYISSIIVIPPHSGPASTMAGSWQESYTRWYNTPYPHLEPWKLQGYYDKPLWWDIQYLNDGSDVLLWGTRRWKYNHASTTGMWENIRTGQVPAGNSYPDGSISTGNSITDGQTLLTYNYFSVNISDNPISVYLPDEVFPPYFSSTTVGFSSIVRSLFDNISEIISPAADYAFGDVGPVEWQWTVSTQFLYDISIIAFLMQPVKFLHAVFGPSYTIVDLLQVETTFSHVYSHVDTLFHGDIFDVNKTYIVRGLNQWYVNFNRYTGFDTNSEFRQLWAGWAPLLTYQFGGIIDTSTFEIASTYYDIINQDYNFILANNGVIKDLWVDAFEVVLLNIPPAIIQYNNQGLWKLELDSLAAIPRTVSYYGVKSFPFIVDVSTNQCTAYQFKIAGANSSLKQFTVLGDQTGIFSGEQVFTVINSSFNNGSYTTILSTYQTNTNSTIISVNEIIPTSTADGLIDIVAFTLPWATGDNIILTSTKFLPTSTFMNTIYYIIITGAKTFKVAETPQDAIGNNPVIMTSPGDGALYVAELQSSFKVFGGVSNTADTWFHLAVDKNVIKTLVPPYVIIGMQNFINVIDGYSAYQKDVGILYGTPDSNDFDPLSGRLIDWQLETERFMDWAYGLQRSRLTVADSYPFTVDVITNQLTLTQTIPTWLNGTAVSVSTSGILPSPLIAGTPYYVVNTGTPGVIILSISANTNDTSSYIDITSVGSGRLLIGLFDKQRSYPRFEINPTRNNAWIDTPMGVLSNVIEGPYSDIRVQQTIFDQYSRPLQADKLIVFRQDKRSHISIVPEIANDVDPIYVGDPYNFIHVGGAHLFVEGFEHFILFNNYTVSGSLIYDQFLGLNTKKYDVDYFEKQDYSLRPTLGGFYLINHEFQRNMEGAATDMQDYYDVMALSEQSEVARRSRALIGYQGKSTFLDLLNINSKSQLIFYRGMIKAKGSVNSITAYINSRRFVDAKVDEFWAWKLAEFGDLRTRVYPEIKLFSTDSVIDDIRLEFLADIELETDPDVAADIIKGFQPVSFRDDTRWNIFPEQKELIQSPLFLDAEVTSKTVIGIDKDPVDPTLVDFWYDTTGPTLKVWTGTEWVPEPQGKLVIESVADSPPVDRIYWHHDKFCDDVRIIRKRQISVGQFETDILNPGTGVDDYIKVNSEVVRFNASTFQLLEFPIDILSVGNRSKSTVGNVIAEINADTVNISGNKAVATVGNILQAYSGAVASVTGNRMITDVGSVSAMVSFPVNVSITGNKAMATTGIVVHGCNSHPGEIVAIQYNATVAKSLDSGITWSNVGSIGFTNSSIALYNSALGLYMVNQYFGTGFATSPDGVTWTSHPSPISGFGMACNPAGRVVIVSSNGNQSCYSDNAGVTWTASQIGQPTTYLPYTGTWSNICWSGTRFIGLDYGVVSGPTNHTFYGDGIHWSAGGPAMPPDPSIGWQSVWGNGTISVALAYGTVTGNLNTIATSSDEGGTWSVFTLPSLAPSVSGALLHAVKYGNGGWTILATYSSYTSSDGSSWIANPENMIQNSTFGGSGAPGAGLEFNGSQFIAVCGNSQGYGAFSLDGATWCIINTLPGPGYVAIAAKPGGTEGCCYP